MGNDNLDEVGGCAENGTTLGNVRNEVQDIHGISVLHNQNKRVACTRAWAFRTAQSWRLWSFP